MTDKQNWRERYDAHVRNIEENPGWMTMSLRAFNDSDRTLHHAVAELLAEAYAMGQAGTPPEAPEAHRGPIRRTKPAPEPEPAARVVRRRR